MWRCGSSESKGYRYIYHSASSATGEAFRQHTKACLKMSLFDPHGSGDQDLLFAHESRTGEKVR